LPDGAFVRLGEAESVLEAIGGDHIAGVDGNIGSTDDFEAAYDFL
jgi:hypothetical protein